MRARCAFTLVLLMPAAALAQSGWGMAVVGDQIIYADLPSPRLRAAVILVPAGLIAWVFLHRRSRSRRSRAPG